MSLNRALTELFKAVREEAARNPEFAERIGEAIAIYKPPKRRRRAVAPAPATPPPPAKPFDLQAALAREGEAPANDAAIAAPDINPISFYSGKGEEALRKELEGESREALAALVAEHNLDPAGTAAEADKAGLIDQIVAQAKKRVERDKALFNY